MTKICDNKSVGMMVWREGESGKELLLIERKRFPFGFACPAGHIDEDKNFEDAAKRELEEEVGLVAENLELVFDGRKENKCRREGGSFHNWKLYEVISSGEIKRSIDETKNAKFYSLLAIKKLAEKTENYLNGKIKEEDWENAPGLETVWCEFFKELGII